MFSSLVTATKNRYASLRAGDEADGDTEDDSHISRVLRNYYTEQGRPFPPWLGGGPQQQQQQQARPGQPAQGVSLRRGQTPGSGPQPGVKTTLSDIWDTPQQQQPAGQQQAAGAAAGQNAPGMNKMRFFRRDQNSSSAPPQQHQQQQHYQGGHQSQGSYDDGHAPNHAAQSSIRDRLWSNRGGGANAGKTPSPQLSPTPPPQQYQAYNGGNSYGSRDKSPARPQGRGNEKPVMSATISFGQDDYEYGGYGGYSGTGSGGSHSSHGSYGNHGGSGSSGYRKGPPLGGGKVGLPSGPRMHR